MGGYGTFKLAAQFPDLFARAQHDRRAVGHRVDRHATAARVAAQHPDPDVGRRRRRARSRSRHPRDRPTGSTRSATATSSTCSSARSTCCSRSTTSTSRRPTSSARRGSIATRRTSPTSTTRAMDFPAAGTAAGHAYWVSGVRLRDAAANGGRGRGRRALGGLRARRPRAVRHRPPASGSSTAAALATPVLARTHADLGRGAARRRRGPPGGRRDATSPALTIDPRRARVSCDAKIVVTSDGPVKVTLAGCSRRRYAISDGGGTTTTRGETMAELREVAAGLQFPEGPVAMNDGSVIVVEIGRGTVTRVGAGRLRREVATPRRRPERRRGRARRQPLRLQQRRRLRLPRAARHGGHPRAAPAAEQLQRRADRAHRPGLRRGRGHLRGMRRPTAARAQRPRVRRPRRLLLHRSRHPGGAHDRPHRRASTRSPTARRSKRWCLPLDSPNGVGLSPDGKRLYVAETYSACVWQWEIAGPGDVTVPAGLLPHGGELLTRLPGFQYLDSLAVDGDGNVCVGTLGSGGITSVSPEDGSVVEFVEMRRPVRDQHLLRRRRPAHRLHHALGRREAGGGRMAASGLALAHTA